MDGPSLGLDYGPGTPPHLLRRLEREARARGVPLDLVELIGAHPRVCKGFLKACEGARVDEFVEGLDVDALKAWRAARNGGGCGFFRRLLRVRPPYLAGIG